MEQETQLVAIREYVNKLFHDDVTGHDYYHMKRVAMMAKDIAQTEKIDAFICEVAGWLHDVGDKKLFSDSAKALRELELFLNSIQLTSKQIKKVKIAIRDVSYSKGNVPETLAGKIVQDADRLDAIGAIGIARTFAYGGANRQLIFHDTEKQNTSIIHFYEKLLKLKEQMHTIPAKKIANERHQFMKNYLRQFLKEW